MLWTSYDPMQVPLKVYAISSFVCVLIDILAALIFLIFCGKNGWAEAHVYFFQLMIVTIYFYTDMFLFFTGTKWALRLPVVLRRVVLKALVGFGLELKASFGI